MPRNPFKRKKRGAIATTRKLLRTPSVVTQERTLLGLIAAERAAHDTKLGKSLADSAEKLYKSLLVTKSKSRSKSRSRSRRGSRRGSRSRSRSRSRRGSSRRRGSPRSKTRSKK